MKVRLFIFFVAVLISESAFSQQKFENALQELLKNPDFQHASTGIHIVDLNNGKEVFGFNSEKLMIPASTMKLVTSAAALEILAPDYRFQTKIGYTGKIVDGTLKGNLVIVGGGDPALGSEYFMDHYFHPHFMEVWAKKIHAAGIINVEGNLVLNLFIYDPEKIPSTWIWEDMGNYYGAGASALTVYDNLFRITFRSPKEAGQLTEITAIYPKISSLEFQNEVFSSNVNRDRAYVFGSPIDGKRVIRGTIPKSRRAFTIKASNPNPEVLLAEDFLTHLSDNGIFISGKITTGKIDNNTFQSVYIQESPKLDEIVRVLNEESVNLFAEHLIKQIGAEIKGAGSRENGFQIINDFCYQIGLDTLQIVMEDGSGLSHFNLVTPQFLTALLNFMKNSKPFLNSLPTAGEGTLYNFNSAKFPNNSLQAKSGSMTRVRCYAGYITTANGNQLAFSIMFNHFSGSHQKLIGEIEKLMLEMKFEF